LYTILLVDDEVLEREAWKYILEKHCSSLIRVIGEAKTGNEAMELAKRFTPDIILMDVKMPGMDGIKAGNLIKEFLPKTKIIVISAYAGVRHYRGIQSEIFEERSFIIKG